MADDPASFRVPEEHHEGILDLLSLSDEQVDEFFSALKDIQASLHPRKLIAEIVTHVTGIDKGQLEEIVTTLLSLIAASETISAPAERFVSGIVADMPNWPKFPKSTTKSRLKEFRSMLIMLLENEDPLGVTAKARSVASEEERLFCNGRIISDIRPIFRRDVTEAPLNALVIHTFRIHYHEDGEFKEISFSIDDDEIAKLQNILKRAEEKSIGLKKLIEKTGIHLLEGS